MAPVGEAVRNVRRRPLRSALTVAGIAIGVTALVLLGALAEKLGRLVEGGREFATGQITVGGAGTGAMTGMARGGLLSGDQIAALAKVPGVRHAIPIVMFPASDAPATLPFTLTPIVFGVDVGALIHNQRALPPRVRAGHLIPEAADEVVIGTQVAQHFGVDVGGTITLRGRSFRVGGVLEPTFTGPDSFIFMPFPTAQRVLIDSEPLLRRLVTVPGASVLPIATAAAAFWEPDEDPEEVARRIRRQLGEVTVLSPADAAAQINRALAFLRSLILGAALAALVVGSLAVTNTMFTAIVERRREIGLRRVVGATRAQVVRLYLSEAVALGLAGTLLGLGVGAGAVGVLNALTVRLGGAVFLLTPRLALAAALLPAGLALLAGVWPAWRAASLPPTDAVRYV